jgi:hypothetical protein
MLPDWCVDILFHVFSQTLCPERLTPWTLSVSILVCGPQLCLVHGKHSQEEIGVGEQSEVEVFILGSRPTVSQNFGDILLPKPQVLSVALFIQLLCPSSSNSSLPSSLISSEHSLQSALCRESLSLTPSNPLVPWVPGRYVLTLWVLSKYLLNEQLGQWITDCSNYKRPLWQCQ